MVKGKNVFVSGGAGVIGTALVATLHREGAKIMIGDLKPRPAGLPGDILYRQGDLNYISREELDSFAPEYFIHLAATFERSTETYDFWEENYQHNVCLSHHLMTCLKDSESLKKIVFASSYLIYNPELYNFPVPQEKAARLKETDPIYPRNMCGAAKLLHEIELHFVSQFNAKKYDAVCARIYRVYGKSSRDIISRWIRALLNGETITVYRPEGLFDYIYAGEVAEGLLKLLASPARGIVNLGNDNARRISEVLAVLKTHFPDMKTVIGDSDIPFEASQANMDRFKEVAGYKPVKQIEDAIPEIIAHERMKKAGTTPLTAHVPVLVSSISAKVPMLKAVRNASRKLGNSAKITGADCNERCIGRYFVDDLWTMPPLAEVTIEEYIGYCKNKGISCVIPSRDGELEFFSGNRERFLENNIHVMISEEQAVKTCVDKLSFYEELHRKGFPVIQTVENIDSLSSASYVVKERFGAGSRDIGMNLAKAEAIVHAVKLRHPVFQPFIKGAEFSVDVYVTAKGKTKGAVARARELVVNGESQITATLKDQPLEALCSSIAEDMHLYGHIVFQILRDADGAMHVIECNSRFGGASTLSIAAGLDSFYWFLLESTGVDIDSYTFIRCSREKKQVRHAEDMIVE